MISLAFIASQNELTMAMTAAKSGATEGLSNTISAIYPEDSYRDYSNSQYHILLPSSVSIINISYKEMGHDSLYEREKIQFMVYAHSSKDLPKKELDSIGDRINYNLRKSIALSFETADSTNKLYNPVFSPHYVFTTANVKWI